MALKTAMKSCRYGRLENISEKKNNSKNPLQKLRIHYYKSNVYKLQALNFDLNGKLSLGDLAMALENELLVTKNGIHQAVLASFKAEIRHLL